MTRASLSKNIGWALAGNAIYGMSQWGIIIAIAKCGTEAMVGQMALAWAVTTPILVFSSLQLRSLWLSRAYPQYSFAAFARARVLFTSLALLAVMPVSLALGYRGNMLTTVGVVGLAKGIDAVVDIHLGRLQAKEELNFVAKVLFVDGALAFVAAATAMWLWRDLTLAALGSALGPLAAWAMVARPTGRKGRLALDGQLRSLLRLGLLGLPLGIVVALVAAQASVPRFFLEKHAGLGELGVFAAISQLTNVGSNVVSSVATATCPRLAQMFSKEDYQGFRNLTWRLAGLGLLMGVCGALLSAVLGKLILTRVYAPEYSRGANALVWLSVAAGLSYAGSFLGHSMTMAKQVRIQVPLFCAVVFVTLGACAGLVPAWGLNGAIAGAAAGSIVQIVTSGLVLRSAERAQVQAGGIHTRGGL